MTIEAREAESRAVEGLCKAFLRSVRLEACEKPRATPFLDVNSDEWLWFHVHHLHRGQLDGGQYVAVHRETGEVRCFGFGV